MAMIWDHQADKERMMEELGFGDVIAPFTGENEFLSNFHEIPGGMVFAGFRVPTSEHAFQMMKTFNLEERRRVAEAATPAAAKRLGRKITMREDWDHVKVEMMLQIVRAKFFQNAGLARQLLRTGDVPIVELNWWGDKFWGWSKGEGMNWLGHILEQVRKELQHLAPGGFMKILKGDKDGTATKNPAER